MTADKDDPPVAGLFIVLTFVGCVLLTTAYRWVTRQISIGAPVVFDWYVYVGWFVLSVPSVVLWLFGLLGLRASGREGRLLGHVALSLVAAVIVAIPAWLLFGAWAAVASDPIGASYVSVLALPAFICVPCFPVLAVLFYLSRNKHGIGWLFR